MRLGVMGAVAILASAATMMVNAASGAETRLTPDNRTSLAVTVYGGGLALISDERVATLQKGSNSLAFEGVSIQMIPSSAWLVGNESGTIREIDYDFDLLTPATLLRRSVGESVKVVRTHPTTGEDTVEDAVVLSTQGGVVLKYRDRIETGVPGRLVFDTVPGDLRPLPALVANVDSTVEGERTLALNYLTGGLSWEADYAVEVNLTKGTMDLDGRVTLTNRSRTDFQNASLGLVAGQVNRVSAGGRPERPEYAMRASAPMADAAAPPPQREGLGDYHLYTIQQPLNLVDQQTKQLALLSASAVPVTREYVSEASVQVYGRQRGKPRPTHPSIQMRFENTETDGAGMPLPAGIVRLYTRDDQGQLRLLGEDRIPHSAVGEKVTVSPGLAFDISVTRRQTDFKRLGLPDDVFESAWKMELRNAKDEAVTVKLVETIPGDKEILAESAAHTKETAERLIWSVAVPAKGTAELTYRVRVQQ